MTTLNTKLHTFTSWGVAVLELRADELETGVVTVTTETGELVIETGVLVIGSSVPGSCFQLLFPNMHGW